MVKTRINQRSLLRGRGISIHLIGEFSVELHIFLRMSRFVPYHSHIKIGSNKGTQGFSHTRQRISVFSVEIVTDDARDAAVKLTWRLRLQFWLIFITLA